jgi:hypothetical protein
MKLHCLHEEESTSFKAWLPSPSTLIAAVLAATTPKLPVSIETCHAMLMI